LVSGSLAAAKKLTFNIFECVRLTAETAKWAPGIRAARVKIEPGPIIAGPSVPTISTRPETTKNTKRPDPSSIA
jgi:hypothetical protein